ncbi:hypothetical protein ACOSQ2_011363 [Xanthoceras sorbifolium]
MTLLLLIVLSIPIFLIFLLQRHNRTTKTVGFLPPGPKALPLIGNLHQFDNSRPHTYLWKLSKQYGPLVSLRLGFTPIQVVSSAKMSEEIYKTHDLQFCDRPFVLGLRKLSYNGLDLAFSPYSPYWRELRKICVVHLFNPIRVQQFRPVHEDEALRVIEKISKSAVAGSEPINLSEIIMSLTSSIICRVALGKRHDDEGSEKRGFHALLDETEALLGGFFFSDYFSFMGWVDRLTGKTSILEKNFKDFDKFYQEIIDKHLNPSRQKSGEEDIIDVLLQVQKESGSKIDITPNHIKAVLMNVFVAGTNTVAAAVIWTMTYLMKNPRAMKKVQEEIRHLIGEKDFVNEDDVQRLPYLKAVLKETMRLQPPIPLIRKSTTEECVLHGYKIPPKTYVYVNNSILIDSSAVLVLILEDSILSSYHLEVAGEICPGIPMSISIAELALANLLYKFDWEMPPGMNRDDLDFDVLPGITMHKKNALRVTAKEKYMI